MKNKTITLFIAAFGLVTCSYVNAAVITFDDAITGSTSYEFDGDDDMTNDVIFSTLIPPVSIP